MIEARLQKRFLRRVVSVLRVLGVALLASGPTMAAEPSGDAHDTLSVLDVKIGMPIEGRPGYTCTKEKRTPSGEREKRHCVKFVDERCKGSGSLGYKGYSDKPGMGCFLDTSGSQATYLNGLLMQDPHSGDTNQTHNGRKPLTNVHLVGTASSPSMIFRIYYTIPEDDHLAEDSKLHKALIAKYGEPRDIHSGKMKWKIDSTELAVQCLANQNCEILVEDSKYEENVNAAQKEADAQKKRDAAPATKL